MNIGSLLKLICIAVVSHASSAVAAEVKFRGVEEDGAHGTAIFALSGPIEPGDSKHVSEVFRQYEASSQSRPHRQILIELHSEGGSYHEGIDLALTFRRLGIETIVRSGRSCHSACAIAFLGGAEKPKDPELSEDADLPDQLPNRRLEKGAILGYHAPYLLVPDGGYNASEVQDAYRAAVLGIARLIEVADRLYITPAELPRLLAPDRHEVFLVDNVDAVRTLGIRYTDYSYQVRDKGGLTASMIMNGCVNRYYHLRRRSSLDGHRIASEVLNEFVEGSKLMENGEDQNAFGLRNAKDGTLSAQLAYLPIAKTADGSRFIWCLFSVGRNDPTIFYRPAGTIEELFSEFGERGDIWSFANSEGTLKLSSGDWLVESLSALDLVPPNTKLSDLARTLDDYYADEPLLRR